MHVLLREYLSGALRSPEKPTSGKVIFQNKLQVPLWLGVLGPDGAVYPVIKRKPRSSVTFGGPLNWYWVTWSSDGALAAVFGPTDDTASDLVIPVGPADLCAPGDIGPVPAPTTEIPIPNDSPSILVGCGTGTTSAKHSTCVTRAQFWKRSGDSITLAPNESVTTSYTSTTGMQETSSDTKTVAESLSASVSAGWGPVSASISASLNTSETSVHQYVATQTDTRFESRSYAADPSGTRTIIRWQLYDVVTVSLAENEKKISQVTTAQHPDLARVYPEKEIGAAPAGPELSEAGRRRLNAYLAELTAAARDGAS